MTRLMIATIMLAVVPAQASDSIFKQAGAAKGAMRGILAYPEAVSCNEIDWRGDQCAIVAKAIASTIFKHRTQFGE